jgi:rare lipoprotein A
VTASFDTVKDGLMTLRQIALATSLLAAWSMTAMAKVPPPDSPAAKQEAKHLDQLPPVGPRRVGLIDHSGRKEKGRASYYSSHFTNRKMADGRRMNPHADIAASKNLPLGTTATVTNLDNGKSAMVKVEDRGPYVEDRVVDLSPAVARKLDIKEHGVVPVVVKPIAVPQPDGGVKLGAGAAEASPQEVARATDVTKELVDARSAEVSKR